MKPHSISDPVLLESFRSTSAVLSASIQPTFVHILTHMEAVWDEMQAEAVRGLRKAGARRLMEAIAKREVIAVAVVPYSTLVAGHLKGLVTKLAADGWSGLFLEPVRSAYGLTPLHDPLVHMSADWNAWHWKGAQELARTLHFEVHHGAHERADAITWWGGFEEVSV